MARSTLSRVVREEFVGSEVVALAERLCRRPEAPFEWVLSPRRLARACEQRAEFLREAPEAEWWRALARECRARA